MKKLPNSFDREAQAALTSLVQRMRIAGWIHDADAIVNWTGFQCRFTEYGRAQVTIAACMAAQFTTASGFGFIARIKARLRFRRFFISMRSQLENGCKFTRAETLYLAGIIGDFGAQQGW